jgi:hypothetical protein
VLIQGEVDAGYGSRHRLTQARPDLGMNGARVRPGDQNPYSRRGIKAVFYIDCSLARTLSLRASVTSAAECPTEELDGGPLYG